MPAPLERVDIPGVTVSHIQFQFVLALLGWATDGQRTFDSAMPVPTRAAAGVSNA
jgi:hypothetical protein